MHKCKSLKKKILLKCIFLLLDINHSLASNMKTVCVYAVSYCKSFLKSFFEEQFDWRILCYFFFVEKASKNDIDEGVNMNIPITPAQSECSSSLALHHRQSGT